MNLQDVTIVGHSLGAHIAGRAAKLFQSIGKVACIIGLDPASIGFDALAPVNRLDKTDADYVQIIHTDSNKFGLAHPIGHGMLILELIAFIKLGEENQIRSILLF